MKKADKIFKIALASIIIFSMLLAGFAYPQRALAFSGGTGTSGDPYQISTAAELASLNSYLGAGYSSIYFELANDINLDVAPYNSGSGWLPIGSTSTAFIAKFDGKGHTISGLFINRPGSSRTGLFGNVGNGGTFKNVTLSNVNVSGGDYTGGLIGYYQSAATVDNVHISGTVTSNGGNGGVGGVIGWCHTGTGPVTYSSSSANINGTNRSGSLIGYSYCPVANSYATGDVVCTTTTATWCGGLVGINAGAITNSYATGSVTGPAGSGRLGGLSSGNFSTIDSSYSTGLVYAPSGTNIGGLVGTGSAGITNSFWDSQTSGQSTSSGGTAKTTSEMKNVATFTNTSTSTGLTTAWDFVGNPNNDAANNNYWNINSTDNDGYPFLVWQSFISAPSVTTASPSGLTLSSAQINGNLVSAGTSSVFRRGFVWGTSSSGAPGSATPESSGYTSVWDDDDFGLGNYNTILSGLLSGNTYYYRAFAQSADGITYGNEASFAALENPELTSPTDGGANNQIDVSLTINTPVQPGSLQLILAGSQTVTLTLDNLSVGTHNFSIEALDPTSGTEVVSSSMATIPDGEYDVTVQHYDSGGFMLLSDSINNFMLDATAPTVQNLSPSNAATDIGIDSNLAITFDELVDVTTDNVTIYNASDDSLVETIPVAGSLVTGNGTNTITINPVTTLDYSTSYYIQIDPDAIIDQFGNGYSGIANDSTWTFTTMSNPDTDGDGSLNTAEDAGPNGGDANDDGILDSQQANVIGYENPVSGEYAVFETSCNSVVNFQIGAESSQDPDVGYDYPGGLSSFWIVCSTPGQTATVRQYYYGIAGNETFTVRKRINNQYTEIHGAQIFGMPVGSDVVFLVQYEITDGGEYDDDGIVDGVIRDPSGAAIPTPILDQNIAGNNSVINGLASTGMNTIILTAFAIVTIGIGSGLFAWRLTRHRRFVHIHDGNRSVRRKIR